MHYDVHKIQPVKIEAHSVYRTTLAVWRGASDILQITIRICHNALSQCHNALYPCSIQTRKVLGNPSPMPSRFPEGHLDGRGKSRGQRGGFPNTSLVWMVHGYNDFLKDNSWRFWHFGVKQGSGEENNHCFRESLLGHTAL